MESGLWVWFFLKGRGSTHRGEGIVQVVDGPGDDDNVVDVQPEGQHSSSKAHTWEWTCHHDMHLITSACCTTSTISLDLRERQELGYGHMHLASEGARP